jgi:Ring hydroxylating beta subunit
MTEDRITRALLKQEIEDFLYHEADLLDERRYDEWLSLLAEDVRYWMPMRRNVKLDDREREFTREGRDISWFDEGKETLTRRVRQIQTGIHWAEEPVSRISHLLSNIQLVEVNPSAAEPAEVSATGSRLRPIFSSASARTCCAASRAAGRSRVAKSCSTRTSC